MLTPHILADGFPPGLIFGAAVFVLWSLGAILNKSAKPPTTARPSKEANELAAIRRRMLEEQARQKQAALNSAAALRSQAAQAKRNVQAKRNASTAASPRPAPPSHPAAPRRPTLAPPPLQQPSTAAGQRTRAIAVSTPQPVQAAARPLFVSPSARSRSETAKNVRLLVQRGAAAEAFILAEIFGTPKGLQ